MIAKSSGSERFRQAAAEHGLTVTIVEMDESTRTAQEAAAACDCDVSQIVKSLIFKTRDTAQAVLLLVSGTNRVDEKKVAATIGEPLVRPDADFVRQVTGYSIGGVPPFGHDVRMTTYMDTDLLEHDTVWAAAGTPKAVFSISSAQLRDVVQAETIAVC